MGRCGPVATMVVFHLEEMTMGLLDSMAGALGAAGSGGAGQPDLMKLVMGLVERAGGLQGLMAKLQQGGLGEVVASWTASGPNAPVSGAQLEGALGSDLLGPLAKQFGLGEGDLAATLAKALPQVIDTLSPQGQLPAGMPDFGGLGGLLGDMLKR
jgi:uncharacterized protein YidB (DUF937 family)